MFEGTRRERRGRLPRYFPPVLAYERDATWTAITGGYVVREPTAPLFGRYLYGDFCEGHVWSADLGLAEGGPTGLVVPRLAAVVPDASGHPLAISLGGWLYRLERAE